MKSNLRRKKRNYKTSRTEDNSDNSILIKNKIYIQEISTIIQATAAIIVIIVSILIGNQQTSLFQIQNKILEAQLTTEILPHFYIDNNLEYDNKRDLHIEKIVIKNAGENFYNLDCNIITDIVIYKINENNMGDTYFLPVIGYFFQDYSLDEDGAVYEISNKNTCELLKKLEEEINNKGYNVELRTISTLELNYVDILNNSHTQYLNSSGDLVEYVRGTKMFDSLTKYDLFYLLTSDDIIYYMKEKDKEEKVMEEFFKSKELLQKN